MHSNEIGEAFFRNLLNDDIGTPTEIFFKNPFCPMMKKKMKQKLSHKKFRKCGIDFFLN